MKKRFPAIVLALALCLGLAVPAFAADDATAPRYGLTISTPDGSDYVEKTVTYQVRELESDSQNRYVYADELASHTLTTPALPLEAGFIISGLQAEDGVLQEVIVFDAWSDPDGDGVYVKRLFRYEDNEISIVPLTEDGPFASTEDAFYIPYITAQQAGFAAVQDESTGIILIPFGTDELNELFGPNTLIAVSVYSVANGQLDDMLVSELLLLTGEPQAPAFIDVPAGQYYSAPVAWAVANEITTGATTTTFAPGKDCTKAQILTFLHRAADCPESSAKAPVTAADVYVDAINWAYEKGMIDDSFDPSAPCTRADAVKYIWQAFDCPEAEASSFSDVPADADYAAAVAWAVENGVADGYPDGTFHPDTVCSRGMIVTLLHRAYVPEVRLNAD